MATAFASRFSVLPDDVDDDYSSRKKKPHAKKDDSAKRVPASSAKNEPNKKKKNGKENTQTQNGKSKVKSNNSGGSKKKKEPSPEEWEKWKQKDEQIVSGAYEDDLSQAILLSKLDYEEKKDFYDQQAKIAEQDKKPAETGKKNKKTTRVLSVEEFLNLGKPKAPEGSPVRTIPEVESQKEDPSFFQRIQSDVKKELDREVAANKKVIREPFDEEALTLAQVRDQLDKKNAELLEVKEVNTRLKEELFNVKTRNKKLCQILANAEMKDKAEVLVQVEKLEHVRIELSEEIASLHAQLEQERSKVRSLTASGDAKSKDKVAGKKKEVRFNGIVGFVN